MNCKCCTSFDNSLSRITASLSSVRESGCVNSRTILRRDNKSRHKRVCFLVRHYKPKPNLEKNIRFGLFSCSSQIHLYRNDYNLGTFIPDFAYDFTLADI